MNINFKKTSDINKDDLLNCLKIWNDEMGYVYPISLNSFNQNIINYEDKDILIAYDSNKVVGFIFLKRFDDTTFVDYTKNLYISLFYVSKKYRRLGIGSKLFDFAEEKRGNRDLIIGKDIDNFFPGVATDFDNLTDVWLEKRGFTGKRYTHDLISHNPYIFDLKNKNIKYQYCTDDQKDELIEMIRKNNWGRWAVEADLYFKNKKEKDNDAYIVGMYDDKIVAFSRINTYNMDLSAYNVMWKERFDCLGGFGPLGVDKDFRKQGIGFDMISISLKCLKQKKINTIILDWTGLMEFYAKFNFEVWKSYKYMQKTSLK